MSFVGVSFAYRCVEDGKWCPSHSCSSNKLIGSLGKDPEKRQVRGNGANFTVLLVAKQQSWKDSNDEWQSKTEWHRVVAFNRLGESIADAFTRPTMSSLTDNSSAQNTSARTASFKKAKAAQFNVVWSARELRSSA